MGCICCPLGSFISSLLYAVERVSTCAACAALVACMLFTIVVACVFGVALGYHFCVVEHNANVMDKAIMGDLSPGAAELDTVRRSGSAQSAAGRLYPAPSADSYVLDSSDRRRSLRSGNASVASPAAAAAAARSPREPDARLVLERSPPPPGRVLRRRFKREQPPALNATATLVANVSSFLKHYLIF